MKIYKVVFIILLSFILTSCDYPEKSFQALDIRKIPTEVTRDFTLPIGEYAPFIWTTDNDVLTILDNKATVNQKDIDTLVVLTARVNKKTQSFKINVLKTGSELTRRERGEDAILELNSIYTSIDGSNLTLPKVYKGLHLKYYLDNYSTAYSYYEDEENIYISNEFNSNNQNVTILIDFYISAEINNKDNYGYSGYLNLFANRLKTDDIYLETLKSININNYTRSFKS